MAEVKEAVKEAPKRSMTIHPTRMRLAEYDRQEWTCNAELGTTLEDVLKPEYWTHMAEMMKQYDHIEVRVDDGSWVADLLVTRCDRNWAKVKLRAKYDLTDDDMSTPVQSLKHKIEFKGPQFKWCVIRLSDSQKVKESLESKEAANAWLREYEKQVI